MPQKSICQCFTNNQKYLPSLKLKKKKIGKASQMMWQCIERKLNHTLAFRGTCYIFSLALFYLQDTTENSKCFHSSLLLYVCWKTAWKTEMEATDV